VSPLFPVYEHKADSKRRFKGFLQIYQLQTENDEEETWKDLVCASSDIMTLHSDGQISVNSWF
jgi:hypothetical protein